MAKRLTPAQRAMLENNQPRLEMVTYITGAKRRTFRALEDAGLVRRAYVLTPDGERAIAQAATRAASGETRDASATAGVQVDTFKRGIIDK